MKNSKKINYSNIIAYIILIGIIISLLIDKNIIIKKETQVVKEMTQSENEANLQIQIDQLNASHKEYATNVQAYKKQIVDAITNQGVVTSIEASADTMANNIGKIGETSVKHLNYQLNQTSISIDKPADVGSECIAVVSAISTVTNSMSVSFNCEYEILDSTFVTADYHRKMYTAIVKIQNLDNITNIQATVSGMHSDNVYNGVSIIILD